MKKKILTLGIAIFAISSLLAQTKPIQKGVKQTAIVKTTAKTEVQDTSDLLSMLGEAEEQTEYATAAFKTDRVINLHSIEMTAPGVLDYKTSHRFSELSDPLNNFLGFDNGASTRLGFDYGVCNGVSIGVNRNGSRKAYDGFLKYRFLRQSTGKVNMPISAAVLVSAAYESDRTTLVTADGRERWAYTTQLILAKKFNENFSVELVPSYVHLNRVDELGSSNDVFALGIAARQKLNKRLALTAEWVMTPQNQLGKDIFGKQYVSSFSAGIDIETGGHVFQIHFTNSASMSEYAYIARTTGDILQGGLSQMRLGFNIARVFTVREVKR